MKSTSDMLLIVHVPKTAGTSLRQALEGFCGVEKVIRDYGPNADETNDIVREYLYSDKKADKEALIRTVSESGAKALIGHFPFQKYADYFQPSQTVAFVRDPLERVCSEYLHRTKNKSYLGTFDEFIQEKSLRNIQSRLLKGVSDQSFIGLTENYPESLRYINALYNLKLRKLKRNISWKGGGVALASCLTESQKVNFYEYNEEDVALFKYCQSRFLSLELPSTRVERIARIFRVKGLTHRNK